MSGLTVRGVKSRLTRARLDHDVLTITQHGDCVRVEGPDIRARASREILHDAGLSCAPYPDYDLWSVPAGKVAGS